MITSIVRQLRPAIAVLFVLTLITGILYPLAVTAVAQVAFPEPGQRLAHHGRTARSSARRSSARPSRTTSTCGAGHRRPAPATTPTPRPGRTWRPPARSCIDRVSADVDRLRAANGDAPIPVDLVTSSASGLDPDISPEAARYQAARIAAARGIPVADVQAVIDRHTDHPLLGLLGPDSVNVLLVNLDLDGALR